jgi:hypothetical protein
LKTLAVSFDLWAAFDVTVYAVATARVVVLVVAPRHLADTGRYSCRHDVCGRVSASGSSSSSTADGRRRLKTRPQQPLGRGS